MCYATVYTRPLVLNPKTVFNQFALMENSLKLQLDSRRTGKKQSGDTLVCAINKVSKISCRDPHFSHSAEICTLGRLSKARAWMVVSLSTWSQIMRQIFNLLSAQERWVGKIKSRYAACDWTLTHTLCSHLS